MLPVYYFDCNGFMTSIIIIESDCFSNKHHYDVLYIIQLTQVKFYIDPKHKNLKIQVNVYSVFPVLHKSISPIKYL